MHKYSWQKHWNVINSLNYFSVLHTRKYASRAWQTRIHIKGREGEKKRGGGEARKEEERLKERKKGEKMRQVDRQGACSMAASNDKTSSPVYNTYLEPQ